jgi:hypothetical protein
MSSFWSSFCGFTIRNSEGKEYMFMCDKGGWAMVYGGGGPNSHYVSQKILELLRKIYHKTRIIITRPTPVLRKIHKMGAPLFSF